MPYLSTEHAKKIRTEIKKAFPSKDGWKFSIVNRHYSSIDINILEGPIEMVTKDPYRDGYEQVNHFYIKEHYEDYPEIAKVLLKIKEIANEGNYTEVVDGDYGAIPHFYLDISIGDWDKPYKVVQK